MRGLRRLRALWGERPVFLVLSLVTLGVLLVWPLLDTYLKTLEFGTEFRYYDYGAYSGALDRWLDGGDIYVRREDGGFHGSYLYPPVTLLVFLPLRWLDFHVAATVFGLLSVGGLWLGLQGIAASFGYRLRPWERVLALLALIGFQPLLFTFKMAQVPTILAASLSFAYVAMERQAAGGGAAGGGAVDGGAVDGGAVDDGTAGQSANARWRGYASGALTTLAASMKLFYATAGAHLLRDRRRLAGALATAGALVVVSVAVFGVDAHLTYLDVLAWGKGWGTDPRSPELWMPAYYRPMYVLGSLSLSVRALGVLAVIALSLAARTADGPTARRATFALGVAVVPLFAPKAYTQDLVVLLVPAVVLLGMELKREGGLPAVPILAIALLHVHSFALKFLVDPPGWLPIEPVGSTAAGLLQPGLWGTLLLVGLAASRVVGKASVPNRVSIF